MSKILIIGYGVVGHNFHKEIAKLDVEITDKYKPELSTKSVGYHDFAFICVDTPLTAGSLCDVTEVENAIMENEAGIYVIKSAVLPKTAEMLTEKTGKRILVSPEYYGATQHANAIKYDFTIIGGQREDAKKLVQLLQSVYDAYHRFMLTDFRTAELVKYMENSFLATKVSFMIQFFEIAEKLNVDYEELRELFLMDSRVNPSHTFVYRDKPYWDSHCFNKDVKAIAEEYDAELLKAVIKYNDGKRLL